MIKRQLVMLAVLVRCFGGHDNAKGSNIERSLGAG